MWKPYSSAAWQPMTCDEDNSVWARFCGAFSFKPSIYRLNWPVFAEPQPSITFAFARLYREYHVSQDSYKQLIADLNTKSLKAFRRCGSPGEKLYALNWNHQSYWLYPHKARASRRWGVHVLPNGDYYIFLAPDFSFGMLGQPWEMTICVFGQPLLDAFENAWPELFNRAVRKNGKVLDPLHNISWTIWKDRTSTESYVFEKNFPDDTHVEISIVKDDSRYTIKTLAKTRSTVSTENLGAPYYVSRIPNYFTTDSVEWALHLANDECSQWDHKLN